MCITGSAGKNKMVETPGAMRRIRAANKTQRSAPARRAAADSTRARGKHIAQRRWEGFVSGSKPDCRGFTFTYFIDAGIPC